jgi:hypothetical protein
MALTKVGPAGIGSTPGTGYVIGNSFLHATGLDATNAKFTGIVTAQTFRVLGNFQVDGTTTTLDTEITSVDKLEVAANNTTVGVAITQSGSGDILNLYDGSTEVFSVADGGSVTITDSIIHSGDENTKIRFPANDTFTVETGGSERVRITSAGKVGIGTDNPDFKLHSNETGGSSIAGLFETNQTDSYISFQASGTTASSTVRIGAQGDNFTAFVNGSERFRVTSAGFVGIGLTNPFGQLQVRAGTNANFSFTTGGGESSLEIINDAGSANVPLNIRASEYKFKIQGTERLRITSDGKIVTSGGAAVGTLTLAGDGKDITFGRTQNSGTGGVGRFVATGNIVYLQAGQNTSSGSAADLVFGNYGGVGERLRINSDGDLQVGNITNLVASGAGKLNILSDNTTNIGIATDGAINIACVGGAGGSRTQSINWVPGFNVTLPTASIGHVFTDGSGYGKGDLFFATRGATTNTAATERFRITSSGVKQVKNGNLNIQSTYIDFSGDQSSTPSTAVALYRPADGTFAISTQNTERLRINSSGEVSIGTASGGKTLTLYGASSSSFRISKSGVVAYDHTFDGSSYTIANNNGSAGIPIIIGTKTSGGESVRITAAGKVLINSTTSGSNADLQVGATGATIALGGDASANGTGRLKFLCSNSTHNWQISTNDTTGGALEFAKSSSAGGSSFSSPSMMITNAGDVKVFGDFTVKKGSSAMQFDEYSNGAVIWLDGANGDFSGGDYFNIMANNSQQLTFGYAGTESIKINTSGQLYLGNYPHDHTVAGGSNLKLRAGAGAWGISLGMRASQNDYAYFAFTDMNGTEQIGDIFMQRTGTSTGHMVFSTNNGNTNSTNRMRIGPSGRLCVSPSANFTSESSSFVMTVVNNGNGSSGGYPGINIRSVATGGNTNNANGMTLMATDQAWSLYGDSGNVHGLGILTGNTASSGNAAMYIRSDKKVALGPQCFNSSSTAMFCHSALHVAGGSLSIGPVNNDSNNRGREGGRYVHGWYMTTYSSGGGSYLHLKTSLWAGGSPHGNSQYIMGGFHIHGYRYSTSGVSRQTIYFHNWNGAYANLDIENEGSWDPGSTVYTSSDGYVVLRLANGSYYGFIIDLVQHLWYNVQQITVTATQYSSSASAY